MELDEMIQLSSGEEEVDLLLANARVVNVFAGDIHETSVAVQDDRIVGLGDYPAREVVDLDGRYLAPGLIDGHVHLESSMVTPAEFARAVVPAGTTTVITDPHEIANVLGLDGIRFILKASEDLPLDVYLMLPSCVPATHLETSGAELTGSDLGLLLGDERVLGLAEVMNVPGVLGRDPAVLEKIRITGHKRIDGHAPGLTGRGLCAYVGAGIRSDHECTRVEEAREKLRLGMYIMLREGTAAKNLEDLLPLINERNAGKCFFVTDDRHPQDLLDEGHINALVRKAVRLGLDPIRAVQMASINTAEYFKLDDLGGIGPGYQADLVVLDDLESFRVRQVFKRGMLVAEDGRLVAEPARREPVRIRSSMNVDWMGSRDFKIPARNRKGKVRVIGVLPGQLVTRQLFETPAVQDGAVVADPARDLLKLAVVERHLASGNVGVGLVQGFGLQEGALASSVAHDSHNIVIVGTSDADMMTAAIEVVRMKGGLVAVRKDDVLASLPLPIAGLMTDRPLEEARQGLDALNRAAKELGCRLESPFMTLSFLALPPIPELKLTDKGLVDVKAFRLVPLFVPEAQTGSGSG